MRALIAASMMVLIACGDDDGTAGEDAGGGADSGPRDGGRGEDAGPGIDAGPGVDAGPRPDAGPSTGERGYWTTPSELRAAHARAMAGEQPWADAEAAMLAAAGAPGDWSFGTIDGVVDCGGAGGGSPDVPEFIANTGGGPVVLAKAYAYVIGGDEAYAAAVREHVLDLTDTTGWGGEVYSGANQCILNLSWFTARFIQAALLIEGSAAWTDADRDAFQRWLAEEVYKKTSWASGARQNNWGSGGSYTSAVIADYLHHGGSTAMLRERDGTMRTIGDAWRYHLDRQLARMNGTEMMDSDCPTWGIQAHGGIPDELRRGSSGCDATYIVEMDASYTYQHTAIQSFVAHAEMLLRRGTASLYDNIAPDGRGSIRASMRFVFENPTRSWPWSDPHMGTMELAYRHYQDPDMCAELACDSPPDRIISRNNRVLSFATYTHAFAPGETPAPPPTASAP